MIGVALAAAPLTCAMAAPPPIEAYGRLPAIEDVSLSPSGKYMLSVGDVDGKRYVLVRTTAGDVRMSVAGDKIKMRSVRWVDDDHALLTASTTDSLYGDSRFKSEYSATLNINIQAGTASPLFYHDSRFLPSGYGLSAAYIIGGAPYAYAWAVPREAIYSGSRLQTRQNAEFARYYPDLWRIDLTTGETIKAAPGDPGIQNWALDAEGNIVGQAYYYLRSHTWVLFHGGTQIMKRDEDRERTDLMGMGRDPGTMLVWDGSSDKRQWLQVTQDGVAVSLWPGQNVTEVIQSPTTGLVIGANIDDSRNVYFDPVLQARFDAATKPFKGRSRVSSVDQNVDKIIIHTFGQGDAGTYYLVDLTTHHADIIDNDYPDVPADQVGAVRRFTFKAADGLAMDGVLTLPPGRPDSKLPVVVLPHGGPIGVHDEVWFDWMAQAFASRGYAVIQPNYRGSSGRGQSFEDAGLGQWGRAMLSDIADALKSQADAGVVDPKRACIVGFSYGGYAALAGVTMQQGLYRCAVDGEGPSDLARFLHWEEARRGYDGTQPYRDYLGLDKPDAPNLNAISPAKLAAKADAPILLIHGTDDTVVPIEQSQEMNDALRAAGKPVEFVITKNEDHWLSRPATRVETLKAAVAFVEKYNPAD